MEGLVILTTGAHCARLPTKPYTKIYKRSRQGDTDSLLPTILDRLLLRVNHPTLTDHIEQLGPEQWSLTATRLQKKNRMLSQAFHAVAALLRISEMDFAAIYGHTKQSKLFPITTAEAALLYFAIGTF
jgi:hypothetical protein